MAFSDSDGSDFVVGQVWGRFRAAKYLIAQVRRRMEFTEIVQAVRDLTAWVEAEYPRHKGHLKLVEDKANGPAVISSLRRKVSGLTAVEPRDTLVPLVQGEYDYIALTTRRPPGAVLPACERLSPGVEPVPGRGAS